MEISEILNNMREENLRSNELFEKALLGISTRLEAMEADDEAVELIKLYVAELKNAIEDKFNSSMGKYDAFEASFDGIISAQSQLAKTSELKELYGVFSAHNEAFMTEISLQKELFKDLDLKLSLIDEKTLNKDDLTALVQDVLSGLVNLNEISQKSYLQIEEKMKQLDASEKFAEMHNMIADLKMLVGELPEYSEEFEKLEKQLENSVKDTEFSDFRVELGGFVQKIIDNSSALYDSSIDLKSQAADNFEELKVCVEDGVERLKNELGLVNYDIASAIECKAEEITRAFEPLKIGIEEFAEFDIEKVLSNLKSQIELAFMNFSVDINSEFASNSQVMSELEQTFKETFNKLSDIEECVNEKIHNNIELLNVALENSVRDIKVSLEGKVESQALELKEFFEPVLDNSKLENSIGILHENFDSKFSEIDLRFTDLSQTEEKVSDMISALQAKVDVLAADSSDFEILEEINGIKDIISEQRKFFEVVADEKASVIDNYLKDVLEKLDSVDLEKNSEDVKETILSALVSLFDQISFIEETEDIKDFVEEKTEEINQNLMEVRNQLMQLTSHGSDFEYTYTLQDVETDIAKLRLAVTNMSGNDFSDITDEIKRIVDAVEGLENSLTQEQVIELKSDIEKLNEDIVSISSRTNKLLLNSDEAYKTLTDGLNNFSSIIYKLEDRLNTENNERIERKIDSIHTLAVEADNANKVSRQVMMYLGEWLDTAGENINVIFERTSEIDAIKENIQELREVMPEKTLVLDEIERKFERQEERIDRLEMGLDKVLSILGQKDDTILERKIDRIENLLSILGNNVEKLTSYVDE